MSGVHKYPTISFCISPREREEIEAKILASGLSKKDYFIRSCIYNWVCVVDKKELIYQLVEELKIMQTNIREVTEQFEKTEIDLTPEGLEDMRNDCLFLAVVSIYPYGKLTIIQGDPGDGKTIFILNIAAKLSKGESLDGGTDFTEPLNVIYQSAEDGLADMVKPRLERRGRL